MMTNRVFRLAVAALVGYAALFPVLSVDVMMRLLDRLGHQDRANLALLTLFESTRALRSVFALTLVALLFGRRIERRDARALVLFLLFGAVAYSITFRGGPYVGPFQEWLTVTLLDLGVSRPVLYTFFGDAWWQTWFALAALLRFSVLFPKPLDIEWIHESGREDRAGLMRGVPGAGVDVGAATRAALHRAIQRGWLNTAPVWSVAALAAIISILLQKNPARPLLWLPLLFGAGLVITALRASYVAGDESERSRIRWLGRGALGSLLIHLVAGMVAILDGPVAVAAVSLLLTIAVAILIGGFAMAVLEERPVAVPAQLNTE